MKGGREEGKRGKKEREEKERRQIMKVDMQGGIGR